MSLRYAEPGGIFTDPFGRRFVVKSAGDDGVTIDRDEPDKLKVATGHYDNTLDLTITWGDFKRNYTPED